MPTHPPGVLRFSPGDELRRFVAVPTGATWATLTVRAGELDTPKSYMLRATALLPHTRYSDSEWRSFTQLSAHQVRGRGRASGRG